MENISILKIIKNYRNEILLESELEEEKSSNYEIEDLVKGYNKIEFLNLEEKIFFEKIR